MSERLPVGETVNEAFQFATRRLVTVIRFGWLPMAATIALLLGYGRIVLDISALNAVEDASALQSFDAYLNFPLPIVMITGVVLIIVTGLLMSGFMASIYRLVSIGEDRHGLFNLRVDGPAFRVFWAQVILSLLNYFLFFIAFIVAATITGNAPFEILASLFRIFPAIFEAASQSDGDVDPNILMDAAPAFGVFLLAGLITIIPAAYLNVRLAPFAAGSAAENRLLLMGTLSLTRGQFWSIFGVFFLLLLALMALGILYTLSLQLLELLASLGGAGALRLIGTAFLALQIIVIILYQAFVLGLQLSTQAIVYRRLKTGQ